MLINRLRRQTGIDPTCCRPLEGPIVSGVALSSARRRLLAAAAVCLLVSGACTTSTPRAGGPGPFPNAKPRPWNQPAPTNAPASIEGLIDTAMSFEGVPYRYGGADPRTGFDCSGLVRYVFSRFDVEVPRTAEEQYRAGWRVSTDELAAGDLVFFSTIGPGPTHVGIVVDPIEHTFVHAPGTGSAVRVDRFNGSYWRRRIVGARRISLRETELTASQASLAHQSASLP